VQVQQQKTLQWAIRQASGMVQSVVVTPCPLVAPLDPSNPIRICISTGEPPCQPVIDNLPLCLVMIAFRPLSGHAITQPMAFTPAGQPGIILGFSSN